MRAIVVERLGGPEVLTPAEIAPRQPGPGEILVRHEAIGLNFIDNYSASNAAFAGASTGSCSRGIFAGGNVRVLGELLELPGDRVLYIGDHIYGDMLRAKRSSVWRTAMIVQELEEELLRHAEAEGQLRELEALDRRRHRIDAEQRYQQLLLQQLEALRAGPGSVPSQPSTLPSSIDPASLSSLGAEVFALGVSPDGLNINRECGARAPEQMRREVLARRADIGIALDGDADRF